jgi:hypothetical protein
LRRQQQAAGCSDGRQSRPEPVQLQLLDQRSKARFTAQDSQGNLYVLQISETGLAAGKAAPGLLLKIDAHGQRSTVADQELFFPGGLTIGPDDALYVSTFTNLPTGGQVLRITPVQEPGTWALMLAGATAVGVVARRRWLIAGEYR